MLENLALSLAALAILAGSALLYDASLAENAGASYQLLAAAVALAGGLITVVLVTRSKFQWRRMQKQNRHDG